MMMLAEFTPDGYFLVQLLGTIGFLLLIAEKGRALFGKSAAQRREVSFAEEFARREDLERVEQQMGRLESRLENALDGLRCEMKEDREAIMQAGEHRAADIHTRMNQMQERLGEMIGRILK